MLAMVVTFPVLGLGFVLWMARIEDSLPAAVRKAERQPDPPPILAIPVTRGSAEPAQAAPVTVHLPAQRTEPASEAAPAAASRPA